MSVMSSVPANINGNAPATSATALRLRCPTSCTLCRSLTTWALPITPTTGFVMLGISRSCLHLFSQPVDRRLGAALAVRDAKSIEADLDHAQGAEHHRRVDMAHMGDADRLAGELADALAEDNAAFLVAVSAQRLRIVAAVHQHRGDRVGTLGRL